MTVSLLYNSPLWLGANGARTCWDSHDKSDTVTHYDAVTEDYYTECGPKDAELLDRVGNKFKHKSILEHLVYTFEIKGVSRALLQELSRHRIASLSVKSTRYTLKELKDNCYFTNSNPAEGTTYRWDEIEKYIVLTGNQRVDEASANALIDLKQLLEDGISNDLAKYCLPEAYKTELQWTINARSLQNFLSLRSDKSALWEIQKLANAIYMALPEDHKYLFVEYIK